MNADLEATLNELGPEYRTVVDRLRAGAEAKDMSRETGDAKRGRKTRDGRGFPMLLAASVAIALALTIWFHQRPNFPTSQHPNTPTSQPPNIPTSQRPNLPTAYGAREYRLTTDEMIATQRADGGWANDFLTRRNAEALKDLDDPRAQLAYKKALRNLRLRHAL